MNAHQCRTGQHRWQDQDDARRCCDPRWRRVALLQRQTSGAMVGMVGWEPADDAARSLNAAGVTRLELSE